MRREHRGQQSMCSEVALERYPLRVTQAMVDQASCQHVRVRTDPSPVTTWFYVWGAICFSRGKSLPGKRGS